MASIAPGAAKSFPLFGVIGDNAALVPGAMYMLFYIYLGLADGKPILGALAAAMIGALVYGANVFAATFTTPIAAPFATVWNVALLIHILGWAVQVYGHSTSSACAVLTPRLTHPLICRRARGTQPRRAGQSLSKHLHGAHFRADGGTAQAGFPQRLPRQALRARGESHKRVPRPQQKKHVGMCGVSRVLNASLRLAMRPLPPSCAVAAAAPAAPAAAPAAELWPPISACSVIMMHVSPLVVGGWYHQMRLSPTRGPCPLALSEGALAGFLLVHGTAAPPPRMQLQRKKAFPCAFCHSHLVIARCSQALQYMLCSQSEELS